MKFFYVYILQSEMAEETFYVGFTEDLRARLKLHNAGQVFHTAKFQPWKVKTTVAFSDRQRAVEFERYLKSASGRAFARKTASPLPRQLWHAGLCQVPQPVPRAVAGRPFCL